MKVILKRVIAYILDIILVSLIATFITSNKYINKDYDKYIETYEEYQENNEEYNDFLLDLKEYYKDNKISEEEYEELKEISDYYLKYIENDLIDKEISSDDYDNIVSKIYSEYSNKELEYSYKLVKLSLIQNIISILCILMYFVVVQYYFNGQTIGKKIMKLQVISNNNKLTILNYFIRSLIVNEIFINIISIICLIILNKNNYIIYSQVIYVITYILEIIMIYMIIFSKDNRGLHDIVSNTKVVIKEEKRELSEM